MVNKDDLIGNTTFSINFVLEKLKSSTGDNTISLENLNSFECKVCL